MKKNTKDGDKKLPKDNNPEDTCESLENESIKIDSEHKGYNENNPAQKSGAFIPDNKTGDNDEV